MALKAQVSSFANLLGSPTDNPALGAELDAVSWQVVSTATNYTIVDDTKNYIIYADTTSTAVTITLAGTSARSIKVVDAGENAGTNIITIAGTIDGATNATIEADGASLEVSYSGTAWESSGGFERFFQRDASTGIITARSPDKIRVASGASVTYSGGVADFSNAEANVSQGASGWGNTNTTVTDDHTSPGDTVTVTSGSFWFGSAPLMIDDSLATEVMFAESLADFYVDLGSSEVVNRFSVYISTNDDLRNPDSVIIYGSSNGVDWGSALATIDTTSIVGTNQSTWYNFDFSNAASYQYYRVRMQAASGFMRFYEIKLGQVAPATTTNTFQYRAFTSGASTTFATNTFAGVNSSDGPIANGEILIEYSTDLGSSWSAQLGLNDFKAVGAIVSTDLWFRFEMVGAVALKTASIDTSTSYSESSTGGFDVYVDAAPVAKITVNGIILPSLTTTQRDAIASPSDGLLIFNTTTNKLNFYSGSSWEAVTSA